MTAQVPDTCTFDGRKWAIEHWDGDHAVVPTSEALGIETVSESTANWSGRIDHFAVFKGRLYLLKIQVNLAQDRQSALPSGAQREVLVRYETMHVFDKDGERDVIREHRFECLVFHNLPVRYTGDLLLTYPCTDYWDQPCDADDDEDQRDMVLSFEGGELMCASER
jgi:hypothetical protein